MKFFEKVAVWVFATVGLAAIAFAAVQDLPAGEGKAAVEAKCTLCHNLDPIVGQKLGKQEWTDMVNRMLGDYGAPITKEEFPVIVDYLAANFGKTPAPGAAAPAGNTAAKSPGAAAADGESLPPGEGREQVALGCVSCHDLMNVKAAKMSKDEWTDTVKRMVGYGASLDDKAVTLVVDYLTANYHK